MTIDSRQLAVPFVSALLVFGVGAQHALAAAPALKGVAHYMVADLSLRTLAKKSDAELLKEVAGWAKQAKVSEIRRVGTDAKILWNSANDNNNDALALMTKAERIAAIGVLRLANAPGSEVDMLFLRCFLGFVSTSLNARQRAAPNPGALAQTNAR